MDMDFVDANRDVLELFESNGESVPKFYVFNQPKHKTRYYTSPFE
jgi:hypothetical protein